MAPHPRPSTRARAPPNLGSGPAARLFGLRHLFFGDIEVGVHLLHVVEILDEIHEAENRLRSAALQVHGRGAWQPGAGQVDEPPHGAVGDALRPLLHGARLPRASLAQDQLRRAKERHRPALRQPDDGSGVAVTVGSLVLVVELEAGTDEAVSRLVEIDPKQAREAGRAHLLQLGERELPRSTLQMGSR